MAMYVTLAAIYSGWKFDVCMHGYVAFLRFYYNVNLLSEFERSASDEVIDFVCGKQLIVSPVVHFLRTC